MLNTALMVYAAEDKMEKKKKKKVYVNECMCSSTEMQATGMRLHARNHRCQMITVPLASDTSFNTKLFLE